MQISFGNMGDIADLVKKAIEEENKEQTAKAKITVEADVKVDEPQVAEEAKKANKKVKKVVKDTIEKTSNTQKINLGDIISFKSNIGDSFKSKVINEVNQLKQEIEKDVKALVITPEIDLKHNDIDKYSRNIMNNLYDLKDQYLSTIDEINKAKDELNENDSGLNKNKFYNQFVKYIEVTDKYTKSLSLAEKAEHRLNKYGDLKFDSGIKYSDELSSINANNKNIFEKNKTSSKVLSEFVDMPDVTKLGDMIDESKRRSKELQNEIKSITSELKSQEIDEQYRNELLTDQKTKVEEIKNIWLEVGQILNSYSALSDKKLNKKITATKIDENIRQADHFEKEIEKNSKPNVKKTEEVVKVTELNNAIKNTLKSATTLMSFGSGNGADDGLISTMQLLCLAANESETKVNDLKSAWESDPSEENKNSMLSEAQQLYTILTQIDNVYNLIKAKMATTDISKLPKDVQTKLRSFSGSFSKNPESKGFSGIVKSSVNGRENSLSNVKNLLGKDTVNSLSKSLTNGFDFSAIDEIIKPYTERFKSAMETVTDEVVLTTKDKIKQLMQSVNPSDILKANLKEFDTDVLRKEIEDLAEETVKLRITDKESINEDKLVNYLDIMTKIYAIYKELSDRKTESGKSVRVDKLVGVNGYEFWDGNIKSTGETIQRQITNPDDLARLIKNVLKTAAKKYDVDISDITELDKAKTLTSAALISDFSESNQELEDARKQISTLENRIETLEKNFKESQDTIKQLTKENKKLENKAQSSKNKKEKKATEELVNSEAYQNALAEFETEKSQLNSQINDLNVQVKDLKLEIDNLKSDKEHLENVQYDDSNVIDEYKRKIENYESQIVNLEKQVQEFSAADKISKPTSDKSNVSNVGGSSSVSTTSPTLSTSDEEPLDDIVKDNNDIAKSAEEAYEAEKKLVDLTDKNIPDMLKDNKASEQVFNKLLSENLAEKANVNISNDNGDGGNNINVTADTNKVEEDLNKKAKTFEQAVNEVIGKYISELTNHTGKVVRSSVTRLGDEFRGVVNFKLDNGDEFAQSFNLDEENFLEITSTRFVNNVEKAEKRLQSIINKNSKLASNSNIKLDDIKAKYIDNNTIKDQEHLADLTAQHNNIQTVIKNIQSKTEEVSQEEINNLNELIAKLKLTAEGYKKVETAAVSSMRKRSTDSVYNQQTTKLSSVENIVSKTGYLASNEELTGEDGLLRRASRLLDDDDENNVGRDKSARLREFLDLMDEVSEKINKLRKDNAIETKNQKFFYDWESENSKLDNFTDKLENLNLIAKNENGELINVDGLSEDLKNDLQELYTSLAKIQSSNNPKDLAVWKSQRKAFESKYSEDISSAKSTAEVNNREKELTDLYSKQNKILKELYANRLKVYKLEKEGKSETATITSDHISKLEKQTTEIQNQIKGYNDLAIAEQKANEFKEVTDKYDSDLQFKKASYDASYTDKNSVINLHNIEEAKISIAELRAKIEEISRIGGSLGLNFDSVVLKQDLVTLENQLNTLSNSAVTNAEETQHQFQSIVSGITSVNTRITAASGAIAAEKKAINLDKDYKNLITTMEKYRAKNSQMNSNPVFVEKFDSIINRLNVDKANQSSEAIAALRGEFAALDAEITRAGKTGKNPIDRFKDLFNHLFVRNIANFGAGSITMYLRQMITSVKEIDSAMTDLKKVTDETQVAYETFLKSVGDEAVNLGITMTELIESTADFSKLGYNLEEASALAKNATMYANVGDLDISTATSDIVSAIKAFNLEISQSEKIVDSFNEVGNKFAISSAEIGEGLVRSASALAVAGNDIDESIALITGISEITQDSEKAGAALKILSLRLRGAKTDLEDAGEETDGMVASTSKLQAKIKALTGVDIMLDDSTFKSTYQIMKEISAVYSDLSDINQASLLELIAGKNRSNDISALLSNFAQVESALDTSLNSVGSAAKENAAYIDSIEGRLAQLKATYQDLSADLINSELVKSVVQGGTSILSLLDGMIDKFGALGSVLTVVSTGMLFSKKYQDVGGLKKFSPVICPPLFNTKQ